MSNPTAKETAPRDTRTDLDRAGAMGPSVIVANRTGGQGKTLVAQLIALAYELAGLPIDLASADTSAGQNSSKLGKFYRGSVQELGIGADLDSVRLDGSRAVAHWDRIGSLLLTGNVVIDLGANIVDQIWEWARSRNAHSVLKESHAPPITLVVPIRAQAQALEDALTLLERSISETRALPIARRVLILNEASGDFERYGTHNDFERLQAMKLNADLKIVRLPLCRSEIWPAIERHYLPLRGLIQLSTETYAKEFHLDLFAASGARTDLMDWLTEAIDGFRAVGIVPDTVRDGEE